jgi:hypothetical protein
MRWKVTRRWRIVLIVLVVLVAFRLTLPYILERYINTVLNELSGYRGNALDVEVHLIQGAYTIHDITIYKGDAKTDTPFARIPATEVAIEWPAVLHGALVGEIKLHEPVINFDWDTLGKANHHNIRENESKAGWNIFIDKLSPVKVNRIRVDHGKVAFLDAQRAGAPYLFLQNVQLDALNLRNTKELSERLPSRIYLQALSAGNGQLNVAVKISLLKPVADFDMDMRFENVDLNALNSFINDGSPIQIQRGNFNMYAELSVVDGQVNGYVKPILNDVQVLKQTSNGLSVPAPWHALVSYLADAHSNNGMINFTTRVVVNDQIESEQLQFLPSLLDVFSNASEQAFNVAPEPALVVARAKTADEPDQTVIVQNKTRKESKREKRKERREEKRKERKEKKAKEDGENVLKSEDDKS